MAHMEAKPIKITSAETRKMYVRAALNSASTLLQRASTLFERGEEVDAREAMKAARAWFSKAEAAISGAEIPVETVSTTPPEKDRHLDPVPND